MAKNSRISDLCLAAVDSTIRFQIFTFFFTCDCRHTDADLGLGPAKDKHMPSCSLWVCLNQIQAININKVLSNLMWKLPANAQTKYLMDDRQAWRAGERNSWLGQRKWRIVLPSRPQLCNWATIVSATAQYSSFKQCQSLQRSVLASVRSFWRLDCCVWYCSSGRRWLFCFKFSGWLRAWLIECSQV